MLPECPKEDDQRGPRDNTEDETASPLEDCAENTERETLENRVLEVEVDVKDEENGTDAIEPPELVKPAPDKRGAEVDVEVDTIKGDNGNDNENAVETLRTPDETLLSKEVEEAPSEENGDDTISRNEFE